MKTRDEAKGSCLGHQKLASIFLGYSSVSACLGEVAAPALAVLSRGLPLPGFLMQQSAHGNRTHRDSRHQPGGCCYQGRSTWVEVEPRDINIILLCHCACFLCLRLQIRVYVVMKRRL